MIKINKHIHIAESELKFDFIRSSGPGGQNVNKVATAVQLRFDASASAALPVHVREKLKSLAGKKMTGAGVLIIEAKRYRTQEKNRQDAIGRFIKLVDKAAQKEKPRVKTKPTKASDHKRIESKKKTGEKKKNRRFTGLHE
jgi:Protein chain release factor B